MNKKFSGLENLNAKIGGDGEGSGPIDQDGTGNANNISETRICHFH